VFFIRFTLQGLNSRVHLIEDCGTLPGFFGEMDQPSRLLQKGFLFLAGESLRFMTNTILEKFLKSWITDQGMMRWMREAQ
jgi:hypothetical protein